MNNPNHLDLTGELIATRISNEGNLSYTEVMKIIRQIGVEARAALMRGENVELEGIGTLRISFVNRAVAEPDMEAEMAQNPKTTYRPFKQGEMRLIPTFVMDTDEKMAVAIKPMADSIAAPGTVRPYYSRKLTERECEEIRRIMGVGELPATEVARRFGVGRKTISKICSAVKHQQPTQEGDDET